MAWKATVRAQKKQSAGRPDEPAPGGARRAAQTASEAEPGCCA